MVSVIIHWDHKKPMDANNKRYIFQLWDYACRSHGILVQNTIFVDLEGSLGAMNLANPVVDTLEEALSIAGKDDLTPVYVHGSANVELPNFEHPENAVYIFGPNYDRLPIPEGAVSVKIPLYAEPNNLFSQSCLPIILYDRFQR
jgi:hypothetical protein